MSHDGLGYSVAWEAGEMSVFSIQLLSAFCYIITDHWGTIRIAD